MKKSITFTESLKETFKNKFEWIKKEYFWGSVTISIILFIAWFLARLNPNKNPPSPLYAALLIPISAIFIVYLASYLSHYCPRTIKIGKLGIANYKYPNNILMTWEHINSIEIKEQKNAKFITIVDDSNNNVSLKIPNKINIDELIELINKYNDNDNLSVELTKKP